MDACDKLAALSVNSALDRIGAQEERDNVPPPGESTVLRVLQSNDCIHDCAYCPFRASRDLQRVTLQPDELADTFDEMHRAGVTSGLYLSSGVRQSGPGSMDAMLATAEILRKRRQYEGFIHLKIMPGAERAQIQDAMVLADQISLNLETPTEASMARISGGKRWDSDLMERLGWIRDLSAEFPVKSGVTTQFVVGAAGETDRELLELSERLYREFKLSRTLYSGFRPIADTPLENAPQAPAARLNRLFQADLLARQYGIGAEEMGFSENGHLWLSVDPKMARALAHPEGFPIEVNTATYEELLRVPGIGPLSARRLLHRRHERRINDPRELTLCGAVLKRAAPFLLLDGRALGSLDQYMRVELRRMKSKPAVQLPLFREGL